MPLEALLMFFVINFTIITLLFYCNCYLCLLCNNNTNSLRDHEGNYLRKLVKVFFFFNKNGFVEYIDMIMIYIIKLYIKMRYN